MYSKLVALILLLVNFHPWQVPEKATPQSQNDVKTLARTVMTELKNKDFAKLATLIHPQKGLRFEPYSTPFFQGQLFTKQEFQKASTSSKKYTWGSYDGSGEPIELSFSDYYKKFVYNKDFLKLEPKYYPENFKKYTHNGLEAYDPNDNDWDKNYPEASAAYYYWPDPEYGEGGGDWASITLVFEKEKTVWYLVAIIHDQWQI